MLFLLITAFILLYPTALIGGIIVGKTNLYVAPFKQVIFITVYIVLAGLVLMVFGG